MIGRIGEYVCGDSSFAAIHDKWVGCAEVVLWWPGVMFSKVQTQFE